MAETTIHLDKLQITLTKNKVQLSWAAPYLFIDI